MNVMHINGAIIAVICCMVVALVVALVTRRASSKKNSDNTPTVEMNQYYSMMTDPEPVFPSPLRTDECDLLNASESGVCVFAYVCREGAVVPEESTYDLRAKL